MRSPPVLPSVPLLARRRPPPAWPGDPVVFDELLARLVGVRGTVVVHAPAGHGKSQVLRQWVAGPRERRPAAWLTCTIEDADPVHLLRGLAAAVAGVVPEVAQALAAAGEDADAELVVLPMLLGLLNEVATAPVVVLDQLDRIPHRAASWSVVAALQSYLPAEAALVLSSRARPIVSLRAAAAAGEVLEVGRSDLVLDERRLDTLLGAAGVALSADRQREVLALTDGWPALAWLVAREAARDPARPVAGHVGAATDYLHEEVLGHLPLEVRVAVARLGVLERIDQAAVDALLGAVSGRWTPARLVDAGVLPPPTDGGVPRHHPLLRQMFLRELQREDGAVEHWHAVAAAARLRQNRPTWAIPHLLAVGDDDAVRAVVHEGWAELLSEEGEAAAVLPWLLGRPGDEEVPRIVAARAMAAMVGRDEPTFIAAMERLRQFAPGADAGVGTVGMVIDALDGVAALHVIGDLPQAREAGLRALDHPWRRPTLQWFARHAVTVSQVLLDAPQAQQSIEPLLALGPDDVGPWLRSIFRSVAALALAPAEPARALALGDQEQLDLARIDELGHFRVAMALLARARACIGLGRLETARRDLAVVATCVAANPEPVTSALLPLTWDQLRRRDPTTTVPAGLVDAALAAWSVPGQLAERLRGVADGPAGPGSPATPSSGDVPGLRPRERDVLLALAEGGTLAEVAERLGVTRETVRTHARALRRRFGVTRTADAVALARRAGLVEDVP